MNFPFRHKPFIHQREEFKKGADNPARALFWEPGTGKTKAFIDKACYLYEQGLITAVLVVAPNGVHRNWMTDEIPAHVWERLKPKVRTTYWESDKCGTQTHKAKMKEMCRDDGKFPWVFMSYNGFMSKHGKKFVWEYLKAWKVFYGLDESHWIKTPGAKRTISIVASGKYAPYKSIMTGTPISEGPFDAYSQVRFLDNEFWERKGIHGATEFRNYFGEWRFAADVKKATGFDPGYDELIAYKNLDELQVWLKEIGSRVLKDDCLDLPAKLYSKRYHKLGKEQTRIYAEIKNEFYSEIEDGFVMETPLAITRLLRLQQLICGHVSREVGEPAEGLPSGENPRLELLEEITDGLSHPAIIWSRFRRDIDLITDLLGKKAVRYDGSISDDEAMRNKQAFQKGDAQYFVANQQSGKEGLTLIQAKTVIYYANNFSYLDRTQSEDRAHRIGQTNHVEYIDIVAEKSVDSHIVSALREKYDIASKITGDKLKEWI